MRKLFAFAFGALALAVSPAFAQSLKSLRAQEAEEAALAREVAYTNAVCGSRMSSSIDWASTGDSWSDDASLVDACDSALGAVEAACRSGRARARIEAVSQFVCAGDGGGPSLHGRTLRFGATPRQAGFAEMRDFLDGLD